MRIRDRLTQEQPTCSFEFFPPKSPAGVDALFTTIAELRDLAPSFVSVTYGAGGSTRDLTIDLVTRIKRETGIEAMAHLTCVGHSRHELRAILERLAAGGIENIMALRGDPPKGSTTFERPVDGFGYGSELIDFINTDSAFDFCLGGGCYPEIHIECDSAERDLAHLKLKADAGVDFLVTQLFFDNQAYFDFVAAAQDAGISVPIVPGIMPVTNNLERLERFGAKIPDELRTAITAAPNEEAIAEIGIGWSTRQCRELLERGVPGLHFYTLNKSTATAQIVNNLRDLLG